MNLNTDYNFEVVLSNGKNYTGTVTTQQKTFTSVTVPANSSVASDLIISWQDVYIHDDLIISVNLITPTGTIAGETFTLTPAQMETGSFVIPKSTFAAEGIASVMIWHDRSGLPQWQQDDFQDASGEEGHAQLKILVS